jgi:nucleoside-diphosphate-sugar epimerase
VSRVLVTGADGFVGRTMTHVLAEAGLDVRRAVRQAGKAGVAAAHETVAVGDIGPTTDWRPALEGVAAVVHLAARAHVLHESHTDPIAAYREVNTAGALRIARDCIAAGVRKFVYVSSIKVNGESSGAHPFSAGDAPHPVDPYGISKLEGEQGLQALAADGALDLVIVRPPLVYGPGVRANFLKLLQLVDAGRPLPFGSVDNRRSLVSVWNLCDALRLCVQSDAATGRTFYVSDDEDVSTPQLIGRIARALGRRPRLVRVPPWLIRTAATLVGRPGVYVRLCGSLQVDVSATRAALGWRPRLTLDEGLARTAAWFRTL